MVLAKINPHEISSDGYSRKLIHVKISRFFWLA